jgi:hypothetical protein
MPDTPEQSKDDAVPEKPKEYAAAAGNSDQPGEAPLDFPVFPVKAGPDADPKPKP